MSKRRGEGGANLEGYPRRRSRRRFPRARRYPPSFLYGLLLPTSFGSLPLGLLLS